MRQVLGAGALGRPRGIGWRGRWERGSGWGIHVNPWLIHVNVWQKPLQYCKVISLQLIKINEKKKKNTYKTWKKKRILEWFAFPLSRGSYWPRDQMQVSCIAGGFCTAWATRRAHSIIHQVLNYLYIRICSNQFNFFTYTVLLTVFCFRSFRPLFPLFVYISSILSDF